MYVPTEGLDYLVWEWKGDPSYTPKQGELHQHHAGQQVTSNHLQQDLMHQTTSFCHVYVLVRCEQPAWAAGEQAGRQVQAAQAARLPDCCAPPSCRGGWSAC